MRTFSAWPDTPEELERTRADYDRFSGLAMRYRDDEALRARLDGGDTAASLAELGVDLPPGIQARIVADTPETMHFVLPPDPNTELSDETLDAVAGGKTASSGGTAGSTSTVGCSCAASTLSSASSVASAACE